MRPLARMARLAALLAAAPAAAETSVMAPLLEAGIPAVDRDWAGADYQAVAGILAEGKVPLPSLADEPGRRFVERFTSTANLAILRNRDLAFGARFQSGVAAMQGLVRVVTLYAARGDAAHAELAHLLAFQLHLVDAVLGLVDEFLPTIPKDSEYESRMAGLGQMRNGLGQVYAGVATSLGEPGYTPADRQRMLAAMAETLPRARMHLSPDARTELRVKLRGLRGGVAGDERKRVDALIAGLDG